MQSKNAVAQTFLELRAIYLWKPKTVEYKLNDFNSQMSQNCSPNQNQEKNEEDFGQN